MHEFQGPIGQMQGLEAHLKECSLEESLRQQVAMRA